MGTAAPITWATPEDWATHRPTITRLYADEGRTLRDVIEIMKRDHSFNATAKMYKTRIKRWKLIKNLTAINVSTVLQDLEDRADAPGTSSTVLIRGRAIDVRKLENHKKRPPKTRAVVGLGAASSGKGVARPRLPARPGYVVTPAPGRFKSPDIFNLPEEIILLTGQLVAGSRDGRLWATDQDDQLIFSSDTLVNWEHQFGMGGSLMFTGRYKHAFKVFDSAFAMLGPLLTKYEPALFIYLILNALDCHPDIGRRLLSYAAQMCQVMLPANHPLTLIWERLSRAGLEQLKGSAWAILISYVDNLELLFGKSQKHLPFVIYWLLNDAFISGLVSENESRKRIDAIIALCESLGRRTDTLQAKTILVNMLMKSNQYPSAKVLLAQVMEDNHKDGVIYSKEIEEQSCRQNFTVCRTIGTVEEAIRAGRRNIQFLKEFRGPHHADVVWAVSRMRMYLDERGISTDGEKLEEYSDPDWDKFCETLDTS